MPQLDAEHTGLRGSGRVGRSAAGRALDENAITLAVAAAMLVSVWGLLTALVLAHLPVGRPPIARAGAVAARAAHTVATSVERRARYSTSAAGPDPRRPSTPTRSARPT